MTTIARKPINDALLTALRAALGALSTPVLIGDGQPPAGNPERFAVLYVLPSTASGPPLVAGHTDLNVIVQITSVGKTRGQCEWVADQVRAVLDGLVLTVTGVRCSPWQSEGPGQAVPEGSGVGALWNASEAFTAFTSTT